MRARIPQPDDSRDHPQNQRPLFSSTELHLGHSASAFPLARICSLTNIHFIHTQPRSASNPEHPEPNMNGVIPSVARRSGRSPGLAEKNRSYIHRRSRRVRSQKTFPPSKIFCTALLIDAALASHHNARNPRTASPRRKLLLPSGIACRETKCYKAKKRRIQRLLLCPLKPISNAHCHRILTPNALFSAPFSSITTL